MRACACPASSRARAGPSPGRASGGDGPGHPRVAGELDGGVAHRVRVGGAAVLLRGEPVSGLGLCVGGDAGVDDGDSRCRGGGHCRCIV